MLGSGAAAAPGARDPTAVISAIYRAAVRGAGPSWIGKGERARDLSKSLVALWARTDKKVAPGDEGPIDFDLVADTNGLTLSGFSLKSEMQDDKSATVAVTLTYKEGNQGARPPVVRYDLVREDGRWKIDEIRSSQWSARAMLTQFLATP
jgi:hypothetical protein